MNAPSLTSSPLVSVIIPCYNAEAYVGDAIRSALGQSYPHVEVIVVDDGSTDRSLQVIRSFEGRIRWVSGPNRGACAARNRGFAESRGEVIQFLDADDLLHPDKIERQLPTLLADRTCAAYCLHDVVSLDPQAVPATQWNRWDVCDDPVVFMLRGDVPTDSTLHHRRAVMDVGGFCEGLPAAQDRDFHLRLALAGYRFRLVPETLLTIRRRSGSISTSNQAEIERQRAAIAAFVFDQLQSSCELTEVRAAECAAMVMRASRGLFQCGEVQPAYELSDQAYRLHRSGGVPLAYSSPTRLVRAALGPRLTESLVQLKRRRAADLRGSNPPSGSGSVLGRNAARREDT